MEQALANTIEDEAMCPICYCDLELDPMVLEEDTMEDQNIGEETLTKSSEKKAKPSKLKKCMVTPCGHYYHPCCLIEWMTMKLECPKCRAELPHF
jgi:hypothetical protein